MGFLDWIRPAPPLDAATRALIAQAIAAVDPFLAHVPGGERKLAPAVQHAHAYCADLAARIPGPYEISRAAFAADPLVHALFGSADDIEQMLATSRCVREHLPALTVTSGHCCALLGMRHREKAGYGVALQGDVVRSEVPQKTLYFSDHTLAEPSPDLPAARQRLRDVLFSGLLKDFAAHVADVRAEHAGLHRERAIEHAQARSSGDPEAHTRRIAALEERLHETADALQPERLLDTLIASLAAPESLLRLDPVSIPVDRSGVIAGAGSETLQFAELSNRDQRRWVVILARIDRDEARRALERFDQASRYIVI